MIDTTDWVVAHWVQIKALAQAFFCGGISFLIAFKFQRNGSTYHLFPSFCAFGIASLLGQQWLSLIGRILLYGEWPEVSMQNTLVFAIMFALLVRSKGNVSRMFDVRQKDESKRSHQ
jgi:hypothetical protein